MAEEQKIPEKEEINKKLEDEKNLRLRALADLDNYKKRVEKEKEALAQFCTAGIIAELLPTLDGFERAIKEAEKAGGHEEILKGIALVKKQMEDTFNKFGVKEVAALGKKFDANFHEAVLQKESDRPEHEIIEVMQKGFTLNGRLLRPAMVIISKGGV
ncbi:nucleotide exchange factor GrpE [Candidatus Margulisiibacteriota bacterium]